MSWMENNTKCTKKLKYQTKEHNNLTEFGIKSYVSWTHILNGVLIY
jgi:hypothetical protein